MKVIVFMSENMICRKIKEGTNVIPLFNVILIQESIPDYFSWLFLMFQGHLQGQKVNFPWTFHGNNYSYKRSTSF